MTLERRLANLEKVHGDDAPPHIILYISGDEPPPSEEEKQALIREEMERNPGQPMYFIMVPRPEGGHPPEADQLSAEDAP